MRIEGPSGAFDAFKYGPKDSLALTQYANWTLHERALSHLHHEVLHHSHNRLCIAMHLALELRKLLAAAHSFAVIGVKAQPHVANLLIDLVPSCKSAAKGAQKMQGHPWRTVTMSMCFAYRCTSRRW
jgi:hypothetical protein